MNSKLQNKQEEFNKLISAEKPKEIDFADVRKKSQLVRDG